jgi:hypothetical protein
MGPRLCRRLRSRICLGCRTRLGLGSRVGQSILVRRWSALWLGACSNLALWPPGAALSLALLVKLPQRYLQAIQIDGGLNALASVQFQNDAVPVSESHDSCAARGVGNDGRINAVDARRSPHIVGASEQVNARSPKRPNADAADTQRVIPSLEVQGAAAAPDDKPCPADDDTD